jgi:hypothetical protein
MLNLKKINLKLIKDWYEWNVVDIKRWNVKGYLKGTKENRAGNIKG